MCRLLTLLKTKWRQYGRFYRYFLRQIGPTRQLHRPDRPEMFIELLLHAVDYEAARKSLVERLRRCEQQLSAIQKVVDELSYRKSLLNTKKQEVPMLESAIQRINGSLVEHKVALEQCIEARDLLVRRLLQCKRKQRAILTQMYSITDLFLLARRNGRFENVALTNEFMICLRAAKDGSEALHQSESRTRRRKRALFDARKYGKAQRGQNAAILKLLQGSEDTLCMQRQNQQQREAELLESYGRPLLVESGYMLVPRRPSDTSSSSGVALFSSDPRGEWSGRPPRLPNVDDGIPWKTVALELWRDRRADLLLQRRHVENNRNAYTARLADHFYMYPNSTQAQLDAIIERELGWDRHENERLEGATLERLQAQYEEARRNAYREGVQDLPLSEDWAASVTDVTPSQGDSVRHQMENTVVDARARRIRRWNRQTARLRPFRANGGLPPVAAGLTPVTDGRALPSPSLRQGSLGVLSSCLSPRTRGGRVRRMSAIAQHLRQQFRTTHGLKYRPDIRRAT